MSLFRESKNSHVLYLGTYHLLHESLTSHLPPFCALVPRGEGGTAPPKGEAADVSTYIHEWIETQVRHSLINTHTHVVLIIIVDYSVDTLWNLNFSYSEKTLIYYSLVILSG